MGKIRIKALPCWPREVQEQPNLTVLVNFGFWIGSLWGDYPGEAWAQGEDYRLWSIRRL